LVPNGSRNDDDHGAERERILQLYLARFPDGRERLAWPGVIHIRVRPIWIRYSNFNLNPPEFVELSAEALANLP
jgi:hypothetical protein